MIRLVKRELKTCCELLSEYEDSGKTAANPVKLQFEGVGSRDVYNIAAPFEDEGEHVIAGRVEARDSEHAQLMFFVERAGVWTPRAGAPVFALQDPFHTRIHGELVVGGVQIYPHPERPDALAWRTVFYKGASIADLQLFFTGPNGMKDLRLVELKDGSVGVFTRPQGEKGGRGKIGYACVSSLSGLTVGIVEGAPLLDGQFVDAEWGGANELHLLANGIVGVLGHIACFDDRGDRHYYPMAFGFDPVSGRFTDIELIAVRNRFLAGAAKRTDLVDVVFSGGIIRKPDGTADLYAGISDAEAHRLTIDDPFAKYEALEKT
ncbi:MTP-1 family protein [Paenibacillus montanisoli]|uniref:DUF1861 domain-containing protein n=1 Tax=Paenibacillus montanisoli TaxID=2081970 RepID=A0A328U4D3_9BACL|nr:DUF1861 family protein [Paenibacillus montanisoli]RAP77668.1 hypothetical protein DL346_04135 [Paenibacillus montanisoli]